MCLVSKIHSLTIILQQKLYEYILYESGTQMLLAPLQGSQRLCSCHNTHHDPPIIASSFCTGMNLRWCDVTSITLPDLAGQSVGSVVLFLRHQTTPPPYQ